MTVLTSTRLSPPRPTALRRLGRLAGLVGSWEGHGFTLIARPDFHDRANVYLQLSETHETLEITPVGSSIPNRGFGQDDIDLHGLRYLQRVNDAQTGGALHLEPGLWVTQQPTTYPPQDPGPTADLVTRMGSVPHGTTLLASGTAADFAGTPTLESGPTPYAGSVFPSFNTTPFAATPPGDGAFNAHGSSEKGTATANGLPPFTSYDLTLPADATNPRTPFGVVPPHSPIPDPFQGIGLQELVDDPILLLRRHVQNQLDTGHTFGAGTVVNIATAGSFAFRTTPDSLQGSASTPVTVPGGGGGLDNIAFLDGGEPTGAKGANAHASTLYATFWIEHVSKPGQPDITQLQYAQMVVLDFPVFAALPGVVNIRWPHVSVATLHRIDPARVPLPQGFHLDTASPADAPV